MNTPFIAMLVLLIIVLFVAYEGHKYDRCLAAGHARETCVGKW